MCFALVGSEKVSQASYSHCLLIQLMADGWPQGITPRCARLGEWEAHLCQVAYWMTCGTVNSVMGGSQPWFPLKSCRHLCPTPNHPQASLCIAPDGSEGQKQGMGRGQVEPGEPRCRGLGIHEGDGRLQADRFQVPVHTGHWGFTWGQRSLWGVRALAQVTAVWQKGNNRVRKGRTYLDLSWTI